MFSFSIINSNRNGLCARLSFFLPPAISLWPPLAIVVPKKANKKNHAFLFKHEECWFGCLFDFSKAISVNWHDFEISFVKRNVKICDLFFCAVALGRYPFCNVPFFLFSTSLPRPHPRPSLLGSPCHSNPLDPFLWMSTFPQSWWAAAMITSLPLLLSRNLIACIPDFPLQIWTNCAGLCFKRRAIKPWRQLSSEDVMRMIMRTEVTERLASNFLRRTVDGSLAFVVMLECTLQIVILRQGKCLGTL